LKMFFIAHHFLWGYPKNAKILGSAFSVCERKVQGENLWRWVRKSRHETFNGRLKFYKSLSDTYRHSAANHVHVFEAICVTVQYQMDNGAEIFAP
jgi:hypothetical protein